MPGGDRRGPMGAGPMTGRAAGYCSRSGVPGYANPMPGRGMGMGFGRGRGAWCTGFGGGRGRRNRFYAGGVPGWTGFPGYTDPYAYPASYPRAEPEVEKKVLKSQADALQSELELIKKRLDEIETKSMEE